MNQKKKPKQPTIRELEKQKRLSMFGSGAFFLIVAVLLFCAGFEHNDNMLTTTIIGIIMLIVAGIFVFKGIKMKNEAPGGMAQPNSPQAIKHAEKIRAQRVKLDRLASDHGTFKHDSIVAKSVLMGIITAILLVANVILLLFGRFSWIAVFLFVLMFILFIMALTGSFYRSSLKKFLAAGLTEELVEQEYHHGRVYNVSTNTICVGQDYLLCSANGAVRIEDAVWAFGREHWVYNYTNGIYTGTTHEYHIILLNAAGDHFEFSCDEASYTLILRDLMCANPYLICGYTEELKNLYNADPASFRQRAVMPPDPFRRMVPDINS